MSLTTTRRCTTTPVNRKSPRPRARTAVQRAPGRPSPAFVPVPTLRARSSADSPGDCITQSAAASPSSNSDQRLWTELPFELDDSLVKDLIPRASPSAPPSHVCVLTFASQSPAYVLRILLSMRAGSTTPHQGPSPILPLSPRTCASSPFAPWLRARSCPATRASSGPASRTLPPWLRPSDLGRTYATLAGEGSVRSQRCETRLCGVPRAATLSSLRPPRTQPFASPSISYLPWIALTMLRGSFSRRTYRTSACSRRCAQPRMLPPGQLTGRCSW